MQNYPCSPYSPSICFGSAHFISPFRVEADSCPTLHAPRSAGSLYACSHVHASKANIYINNILVAKTLLFSTRAQEWW